MGKGAPDPVLAHPPPETPVKPFFMEGDSVGFSLFAIQKPYPYIGHITPTTALSPSFANISPYFGLRGGNLWD